MATAEEYAQWIVDNQSLKGTPDFEKVAQAYKIAREQPQERGIVQRVTDIVTGNDRKTETTESLPDWAGMPELNQLSLASAKTGLGTLLSSPEETAQIIKSNFPQAQIKQDEKGNFVITSSVDGKDYAIKPGFRVSDIPRALGALAAFTPAGRATTIPRMAGATAATQGVIEGTQAATGGTFNPAEVAIAGAVGGAVPAVVNTVKAISQPVRDAFARIAGSPDVLPQAAQQAAQAGTRTAGGQASMGAAGQDLGTLRQTRAEELGFTGPSALTEGQRTRDFAAQRFERETAKNPELGAPIRERFANQNRQLQQTLDSFIDETGSGGLDLRSIGMSIDKGLRDKAAIDKAKVRSLYKEAEKAGELQGMVDISALSDYLNANRAGATSAPIMQTTANELRVQGIGGGSLPNGDLQTGLVTLKQAEDLRKVINKFTKSTDPNDIRISSDLRTVLDEATKGAGGQKYQAARAAAARYKRDFENIALVNNIIGRKANAIDRPIAIEDILNRSIINPSSSLDEVRHIRRLLQTGKESGQQAWKDIQGGTLQHIREQATRNVARNEFGDPVVSASGLDRAISGLDKSGKLDFIFGKNGADRLRALNDIAKDVLVANPNAVNTSNTASVILAAMDMAISGTAGVPAPILSSIRLASKGIKNARTKARVRAALGE